MLSAVEYFKEKSRMTKACEIQCFKCPLSPHNTGCDEDCAELEREYPEKAVEIVENWSKEHPVKTYLDDLLEKYPKAELDMNGAPNICPHVLYENAVKMNCFGDECLKCWKQPLIED